jgi:hypothetical protein
METKRAAGKKRKKHTHVLFFVKINKIDKPLAKTINRNTGQDIILVRFKMVVC